MKYIVKVAGEYVKDVHGYSKAKQVEKTTANRALRRSAKNLQKVDCFEDVIYPPTYYKKRMGWLL